MFNNSYRQQGGSGGGRKSDSDFYATSESDYSSDGMGRESSVKLLMSVTENDVHTRVLVKGDCVQDAIFLSSSQTHRALPLKSHIPSPSTSTLSAVAFAASSSGYTESDSDSEDSIFVRITAISLDPHTFPFPSPSQLHPRITPTRAPTLSTAPRTARGQGLVHALGLGRPRPDRERARPRRRGGGGATPPQTTHGVIAGVSRLQDRDRVRAAPGPLPWTGQ